ncbi:MAG: DUF58 domain-containing protein [Planctomycetaceae bacterium]|nr:DUF58 domain-containing protein [Planctomycetaceae bacterium]
MSSILYRYLDADALGRMSHRRIEPRGLVLGNLAGAHKSPLSGFAVEFAGHREYSPGDDPKHIDWRVYFRHDKYLVKQYEMETNFVCHLLLDCSASMRYGDGDEQKLLYAARLATTLGHRIVHESDKVSLATFDARVLGMVPPSNSMAQVVRITEHLDQIKPREKTDMAGCLADLVGRMGRREIVMIFSDFFTDLTTLEPVLQRMRYLQHEVVLFHVLHHDELAFDFEGMTKFVGLEVDDILLAEPQELRTAYLAAVQSFNEQLEDICQRNRIERVLVDTRREMAEVLIDYLNHRSRLNRGR